MIDILERRSLSPIFEISTLSGRSLVSFSQDNIYREGAHPSIVIDPEDSSTILEIPKMLNTDHGR